MAEQRLLEQKMRRPRTLFETFSSALHSARQFTRPRLGRRLHLPDEITMKLRILGCSGGIGGDLRTTSMLLDSDVLIDAGTGVGDLSIAELTLIDHIFVTHSHMDHVASIPFLADTVGWMRDKPITIYATRETLAILREHLFNWKLWPDFSEIPDPAKPMLRYQAIDIGVPVSVGDRTVTALPGEPRGAGRRLSRRLGQGEPRFHR